MTVHQSKNAPAWQGRFDSDWISGVEGASPANPDRINLS
jgi:hypothetical protein